jgi:hypothetical protein
MLRLFIIRFEIAFIITDKSLNKFDIVILVLNLLFVIILWTTFKIMILLLRVCIKSIASGNWGTEYRIIMLVVLSSVRIVIVLRNLELILRNVEVSGSLERSVLKIGCILILGLNRKILGSTLRSGARHASRPTKIRIIHGNSSIVEGRILRY